MRKLFLRDHDQAFVQSQFLFEDVKRDGIGAFAANLTIFVIEDYEATMLQRPPILRVRALITLRVSL